VARTWVLRTETKGTGAQMVPLESVTKRGSEPEPVFIRRKPAAEPKPVEPRGRTPHRFKVVDVVTRESLAENVGARAAVDILKEIRSTVDVNVYVWREEIGRWQMLSFTEQRALMDLAKRPAAS
jgi:hypothetical protein